jgi:hypothetical protein
MDPSRDDAPSSTISDSEGLGYESAISGWWWLEMGKLFRLDGFAQARSRRTLVEW